MRGGCVAGLGSGCILLLFIRERIETTKEGREQTLDVVIHIPGITDLVIGVG